MMVLVLINDVTSNIGFIGKTTCDGPDNFGGVNSATSGCGDNGTGRLMITFYHTGSGGHQHQPCPHQHHYCMGVW